MEGLSSAEIVVSTALRVVVTGARGGVGAQTVRTLLAAGHEVIATDRLPAAATTTGKTASITSKRTWPMPARRYSLARGADVVVHAAAIPTPEFHPPHVVFGNNLIATFNMLEAAVRCGVARFVNVSSETVPGFIFAERPFLPDYVPDQRRTSHSSARSLRPGEALRRTVDGRRRAPVRHPLHLDPTELGPASRRLRRAT